MKKDFYKSQNYQSHKNRQRKSVITHTMKGRGGIDILINFESLDDYLRFIKKYNK